jgi:hypothetical protein
MDMSTEAVYLMDVTAGDAESGMVGADRLLIGCFEQAVNLTVSVVIQLDLTTAELVRPGGTSVVGDLRDCLFRQLQVLVVIHETWHRELLSSAAPLALSACG